ncbi:Cbwd1 [Symbiodinium sp. CCMP2592]|nr:Cbwd1 [Symbiodinium sp. CCMP2592]
MATRLPVQQSYGTTIVPGPPVAMAQLVVQPGSPALPVARTIHVAKEGPNLLAPTVSIVLPHPTAAVQPHQLPMLLGSKSVDRLYRPAPTALGDGVRSWAPIPAATPCTPPGPPQTPQKVWTSQGVKAACAVPLQVPSSVSTAAPCSSLGQPGSLLATPSSSEKPSDSRRGRMGLGSLREQLVQASVELGRMQATLADMGTKLPAAWTGKCPGKAGPAKSGSTGPKESPLQAVQRAVKQLQGNLEESLTSAEKVPTSPDTRKRTFSASSREPSVSSVMKGRGSQQASPVQRTRPMRQVSAPSRRPSEASTSSRTAGAGISSSMRSTGRRGSGGSDARERMRRRFGQSLASTTKDLRSENHRCEVEESEGRSVSSDIRPRKPRPPMAAVLSGSSRDLSRGALLGGAHKNARSVGGGRSCKYGRSPGQVLSEARRWRDAGNSTGILQARGSGHAEDPGLSPTDSSSERLPKPTLTPVLRCR